MENKVDFFKTINTFFQNEMILTGMTDSFFSLYLEKLQEEQQKHILIVTSTLYSANELYHMIPNSILFPMDDILAINALAISPDLKTKRLEVINKIIKTKDPLIVVTHLEGYIAPLIEKKEYENNIINLKKGINIDLEELTKKLFNMGYEKETLVTKTGEIGVRGFVLDVFPIGEENPIRLEFFGDEIEKIKCFDIDTQRTIEEKDSITIFPNKEIANYSQSTISDYLYSPLTIYKDYDQMKTYYSDLIKNIITYEKEQELSYKPLEFKFNKNIIFYNTINNLVNNKKEITYEVKEISRLEGNNDLLKKYLSYYAKDYTIIIILSEEELQKLEQHEHFLYKKTTFKEIYLGKINVVIGKLSTGFIYSNFAVITSNELFKSFQDKIKYETKFKYSTNLTNINTLEKGDYVVHENYGIGIYLGMKALTISNITKDYLYLDYKGDKLYVPVERINLISKYSSKDGAVPFLNHLGTGAWNKAKQKATEKIEKMAQKLIALYAERKREKGFAYSPYDELEEEFAKAFLYEPTRDQEKAFFEIANDMEKEIPMDHLLCGDVGYGKTEVAFRAMFKAIKDGKQVLYLCPTTILSLQQYQSSLERFKNIPVNIKVINRFVTPHEQKQIVDDLKLGKIDILFGTHRLLSDDIKPHNLGLLVIDEEQRFGVNHKEKIKNYKKNIDVLTLSATPIPRTLYLSLSGIRNLSLIETPPRDRYPVQTYVISESDFIVKDAIYKELTRKGQVFILYNHVQSIEKKKEEIKLLIPEASIVVVHGQLTKEELEKRMYDFINKKYDVLLCTTIIETGIDIPNVNTLIIYDADRFGLSQLYQIRGRVGRSNKIAYAYLMYKKEKILTEDAIKRLKAIKEFTQLGDGFKIANRDLAIRGAGNVLGSEQTGFIYTIGYELYNKILNKKIEILKAGKVEEKEEETEQNKPNLVNVTTHISDKYVENEDLKIMIHQKINTISSLKTLIDIKTELEDRFGKINEDILIYMYSEWFEKMAREEGVVMAMDNKNETTLVIDEKHSSQIEGDIIFHKLMSISRNISLNYRQNEYFITLLKKDLDKHYLLYLIKIVEVLKEIY